MMSVVIAPIGTLSSARSRSGRARSNDRNRTRTKVFVTVGTEIPFHRRVGNDLVQAAADERVFLEQLDRNMGEGPVPRSGTHADGALIAAVRKAAELSAT